MQPSIASVRRFKNLRSTSMRSVAAMGIGLLGSLPCVAAGFDSDSLKYAGENPWCWMGIPESRIVVNPYTKVVNGVPPSTKNFALHAGFIHGKAKEGDRLNNLIQIELSSANDPSRTWWPYKLEMNGRDEGRRLAIRTTDFCATPETLVRIMSFKTDQGAGPVGSVVLQGGFEGRTASLQNGNVLVVDHGGFYTARCLAVPKDDSSVPSALASGFELGESGWRLGLPKAETDHQNVVASVGFAMKAEGAEVAARRAQEALLSRPALDLLAERKQAWDQLLAKVPHPKKFGVKAVGEVTPETHRLWYYGAWTFLLSQWMGPMPENDYPYYSIGEGKASLWCEGDPAAPAQCSWTCFIVMGLMGEIMPEQAWSAYEGIMARVNEEGLLLGECLPSRKAQGAWLLYSATGDRERLARVYPAIKRYLIWREKNPRWIWGTGEKAHDIPDEKDSSFVVSHLIDMEFAIRIAKVLGLQEDVGFWEQMTKRELGNYRKWFFPTEGDPMNFYFADTGLHVFKDRQTQEPCYILTGLAFKGMPQDLVERLQKFYKSIHDPAKPLVGFKFTKYGETSFMAYGLIDRGMKPYDQEFVSQLLVDTMRPGADFGEELKVNDEGRPTGGGVQPSLFLVVQTIDFTLLQNGIRIDQGKPAPTLAGDKKGASKANKKSAGIPAGAGK